MTAAAANASIDAAYIRRQVRATSSGVTHVGFLDENPAIDARTVKANPQRAGDGGLGVPGIRA